MVDPIYKTKLMEFLRSKMIAVISTISSEEKPESATIYYDVDENFNFYFMTKIFTRKYANLEKNTEVALVIGTENEPITAQIQGKAKLITDNEEYNLKMEQLEKRFLKNEYVAPLFQLNSGENKVVLFKVTPTWIRWLDLRGENINGNFIQIL